jgi:hypothetical protein
MAPPVDDMRELLVLSQMALHMLQNQFATFMGVSDRTMRRWTERQTRLTPRQLAKLVTAVHARDPLLAGRIAAVHGVTLEDLGLGLSPEKTVAYAIVAAAAGVAEVPVPTMRVALAAATTRAKASGLTVEAVCELLAGGGVGQAPAAPASSEWPK